MENTSSTLTAFRQAEKHFKSRANKDIYPSLRQWQDRLIDLSRPDSQEEDEIWAAGWWSPDHDVVPAATNGRRRKGIEKKNKGERPDLDIASLESLSLHGGKTGYIVAPGACAPPDLIDRCINFVTQDVFLYPTTSRSNNNFPSYMILSPDTLSRLTLSHLALITISLQTFFPYWSQNQKRPSFQNT